MAHWSMGRGYRQTVNEARRFDPRWLPTADGNRVPRRAELGAVRLKTIVVLVFLGAACYAGLKVFAPYYANAQLEDKMRQEARFARVEERSTEQLRDIIFVEAKTHDIPLRREDIRIENSPSGVLITTDYNVTVDLHLCQLNLHFHAASDSTALSIPRPKS